MVNLANYRLRSVGEFGAPQQISTGFAFWLCYCTDVAQRKPTKLCTMFGHLLDWPYVHFRGFLLLTEFCQVQNSLCFQVLRPPVLAAVLHSTRVVGVSQTAALSKGRHLYSAGMPSRWALAHILVNFVFVLFSIQADF